MSDFDRLLRACFLPAAVTAAACSSGTEPSAATTVSITSIDTLRSIGETGTLTASVLDQRGQPIPGAAVTWTSSHPAFLTVNGSGEVTAIGNGMAVVTARAGAASGTRNIVVRQRAATMAITVPDTMRALTAVRQAQIAVQDAGGTNIASPGASWSSTSNAIASVNATGLVTAVGNGSVYIKAAVGSLQDSAVLVVRQRVDVAKSTLTAATATLFVDDTARVTVQARDSLDQPIATGDLTVAIFAVTEAGVSGLTAPAAVDRGNGEFSADFVGVSTGTPRAIRSTINGTQLSAAVTLRVIAFKKITASSEQSGTCGILTTGDMYCWGEQNGTLRGRGFGAPAVTDPTPTLVSGGHQWADAGVGQNFICALTVAGKLYCWGAPGGAQLGNGSAEGPLVGVPTALLPDSTFTHVSINKSVGACAVTMAHNTVCWGLGLAGQLGNGADTNVVSPVAVIGGVKFVAVAASGGSTCAISEASALYCWGHYQTMGGVVFLTADCAGPTVCAKMPMPLPGGRTYKPVVVNDFDKACAITTDDRTFCWDNTAGVEVTGGPAFTSLATGSLDFCGLTAAGAVHCWGRNVSGRFGSPADINQITTTPVPFANGIAFTQISMGRTHMCGIVAAGRAWCWGSNEKGQLGNGSTAASTTPVRVRLP